MSAVSGLMMIALILVCVAMDITTAIETVVIAVAYSLRPAVLVYRSMTRAKLCRTLVHATKTTGVTLLLIAVSSMLRFQIAYLGIPDATEQTLTQTSVVPWLMLFYINILWVSPSMLVNMAAHILIITPLFLPMATHCGVGPVQLGTMLLLNCSLGLVHPPIDSTQLVGRAIGEVSIGETTKIAWPYHLVISIAINVMTYVLFSSARLPSVISEHPVL